MLDLKYIHIGSLIEMRYKEMKISTQRTCRFLKCKKVDIEAMFVSQSLDAEVLLRWSKLLEYDFFRLYSQHLILYSPKAGRNFQSYQPEQKSALPQYRKNMYTREIIDFVLEQIDTGKKTKAQITEVYGIPKTTLYKWIAKYSPPQE
ncbi:transposase [Epilithonimonas sp. JDS]|uniref:transposase n=1 Tax=Epilithonimonas sp. JDS TaxID=2902797 RepID=UPI00293F4F20|nr:transposase [Epilithonimonas sp. JDS]